MTDKPLTAIDFLGQARGLYAAVGAALEGSAEVPGKADRNLSELGSVLRKLEDYARRFPLSFDNHTVCMLFGQVLKLFPLLLHDMGGEVKRSDAKDFARFASGIFVAVCEEKYSAGRVQPAES